LNDAGLIPTPSQTAGPFFHLGCTDTHAVSCLANPRAKGERIWLTFRVLDGSGAAVDDAMVEIWQADSEGKYNHPADAASDEHEAVKQDCTGFGRLATDKNGKCIFETVRPGRVAGNDGRLQAPHLNVSLFARGVLNRLATRIYFNGEAANEEDAVLSLVPVERRVTLMAHQKAERPGHWHFDVRLSGENETVFFDI
jgi:protocatechuate 3,4-dioxygenase, alpha subunit